MRYHEKKTGKIFQKIVLFCLVAAYIAGIIPFGWSCIKSAQSQTALIYVTATAYSYGEPTNITATGKHVSEKYIAVSRDVERVFPMHTHIKLTCGKDVIYAIVEDRMHLKWNRRVDVFKTTKKACRIFGVKKNCQLEKVKGAK